MQQTDGDEEVVEEEEDFNSLDLTFGMLEYLPGLSNFFSLSAPFDFVSGFLAGTEIAKDEHVIMCEKILAEEIIDETE